jgi:cell division septal protein FtsQ
VSRSPRQSPARAAVARLPAPARAVELLPSSRSIALGFAVAGVAVLAFVAARESSVFAVQRIEVHGVDPKLARRVETSLEPLRGSSLLKVHGDEVRRLATALPTVAGVAYDRAFPNTLRVAVQAEEPVAVVRHGARAWLVSRRSRLIERIAQRTHRKLPRIWLAQALGVRVGGTLRGGAGAEEVALLDGLRGEALARQVRSVRQVDGQWTYVLRGGLQIRVGDVTNLSLKLAVAAAILRHTPIFGYLDVSVPQRPVAYANRQLSG